MKMFINKIKNWFMYVRKREEKRLDYSFNIYNSHIYSYFSGISTKNTKRPNCKYVLVCCYNFIYRIALCYKFLWKEDKELF